MRDEVLTQLDSDGHISGVELPQSNKRTFEVGYLVELLEPFGYLELSIWYKVTGIEHRPDGSRVLKVQECEDKDE